MFKKSLLSLAAVAALSVAASSAHAVVFDFDGVGGSAVTRDVISLDWLPDNALSIGALSTPPNQDGTRVLQTVAQGTLGIFGTTVGNRSALFEDRGVEYTFQTSFFETATGIGTNAASFVLAPGANYFRVYADFAGNSNQVTGTGYGDGTLILEGFIDSLTGTFTDATRQSGAPIIGLDQFSNGTNGDVDGGVTTHVGNGSNTVNVDITFLDPNFFLGNVASLVVNLNYGDTTNLASPFITAQPSDLVVGITPSYSNVDGAAVNGANCTVGGITEAGARTRNCDFHFQSDASGSFRVAEPGSLALIGLALGAAGIATRRKKA